MLITCPHCKEQIEVSPGAIMGSIKSEKKAAASRINGAKHKGKKEGGK